MRQTAKKQFCRISFIQNNLAFCTICENVQIVNFTNCPHTFPKLSVRPRNHSLSLLRQRERKTSHLTQELRYSFIKNLRL